MASPTAADLRQAPLFESVTDEELTEIAPWFEIREVAAGESLAREGASGYAFLVLGTASAEVSRDDTVVSRLGPGEFFGEGALLGGGRRGATVTAVQPGTVWVLFGTRFRELGMRFPTVQAEIERVFTERLG